jgi:hypothetical protein
LPRRRRHFHFRRSTLPLPCLCSAISCRLLAAPLRWPPDVVFRRAARLPPPRHACQRHLLTLLPAAYAALRCRDVAAALCDADAYAAVIPRRRQMPMPLISFIFSVSLICRHFISHVIIFTAITPLSLLIDGHCR